MDQLTSSEPMQMQQQQEKEEISHPTNQFRATCVEQTNGLSQWTPSHLPGLWRIEFDL